MNTVPLSFLDIFIKQIMNLVRRLLRWKPCNLSNGMESKGIGRIEWNGIQKVILSNTKNEEALLRS